jgi:hypothetical protein
LDPGRALKEPCRIADAGKVESARRCWRGWAGIRILIEEPAQLLGVSLPIPDLDQRSHQVTYHPVEEAVRHDGEHQVSSCRLPPTGLLHTAARAALRLAGLGEPAERSLSREMTRAVGQQSDVHFST